MEKQYKVRKLSVDDLDLLYQKKSSIIDSRCCCKSCIPYLKNTEGFLLYSLIFVDKNACIHAYNFELYLSYVSLYLRMIETEGNKPHQRLRCSGLKSGRRKVLYSNPYCVRPPNHSEFSLVSFQLCVNTCQVPWESPPRRPIHPIFVAQITQHMAVTHTKQNELYKLPDLIFTKSKKDSIRLRCCWVKVD